ncbi:ABC transporter substrate-binding protein [Leucobacter chromiiresistens]|uniref:Amino acid ABC transporter substrate-binding protein, PAAT family n=1 Tax=Leucobacter chromiiresistens TaxID=1079994 RepID=A0A1H0YN85_9MICO|nr:ABC transporter substrate-binding protein [Leucobacter chromiiresistens]SDQ16603.1 amino acid ABC transporter substrate-binding protein, PAAT family [Leucobacter chromiiresistens]
MTKYPLALLATAAVATLALSGCSGSGSADAANETASSSLPTGDEITTTADAALGELLPEDIVDAGVINIAVDIPFPPMAMYDENNREIGFDPELGRLLGQKLGIDVSLNKQAFDSVIPSLQANKNDIIMSGMNDTPERQETLSFIDYTHGGFAIAVQKGNPEGITTQRDLCGKTVSVQKATVQGDLLRAMDCDVDVMELPSDLDAQTALRAGKSQAYTADAVVAEYVVATTDDGEAFEIVRDPENPAGFNPVYSGIGVLKDDTELIEAVRQALQALIDEGTYQEVLERNSIGAYAVESAEVNQGADAS